MSHLYLPGRLMGRAGVLVLALTCGPAPAQQPASPKPPLDIGKGAIELPVKTILANNSAPAADSTNPTVPPGKVRWHATFGAACQAARKSGKPVLLFQMMGQLDQQFC
jgi:hypothetical protein